MIHWSIVSSSRVYSMSLLKSNQYGLSPQIKIDYFIIKIYRIWRIKQMFPNAINRSLYNLCFFLKYSNEKQQTFLALLRNFGPKASYEPWTCAWRKIRKWGFPPLSHSVVCWVPSFLKRLEENITKGTTVPDTQDVVKGQSKGDYLTLNRFERHLVRVMSVQQETFWKIPLFLGWNPVAENHK